MKMVYGVLVQLDDARPKRIGIDDEPGSAMLRFLLQPEDVGVGARPVAAADFERAEA